MTDAVEQYFMDAVREQERAHVRARPVGECTYCDAYRDDQMMPAHTASSRCESGKRNHCTCDICF